MNWCLTSIYIVRLNNFLLSFSTVVVLFYWCFVLLVHIVHHVPFHADDVKSHICFQNCSRIQSVWGIFLPSLGFYVKVTGVKLESHLYMNFAECQYLSSSFSRTPLHHHWLCGCGLCMALRLCQTG